MARRQQRNYGGFVPINQLSLTKTQLRAVLEYTGGESVWLNKYLDRWAQIDTTVEFICWASRIELLLCTRIIVELTSMASIAFRDSCFANQSYSETTYIQEIRSSYSFCCISSADNPWSCKRR